MTFPFKRPAGLSTLPTPNGPTARTGCQAPEQTEVRRKLLYGKADTWRRLPYLRQHDLMNTIILDPWAKTLASALNRSEDDRQEVLDFLKAQLRAERQKVAPLCTCQKKEALSLYHSGWSNRSIAAYLKLPLALVREATR